MDRKWLPLAPAGAPVWFDVVGFIPTRSGSYATGCDYAALTSGPGGTPGTGLRAWCALLVDDSLVAYAGTTTKLYSYSAGTMTDRSRGGGYTNTATDWSFVQFGNRTLAANKVDATQERDGSLGFSFSDLAGAPKAAILVTQALQILALNINDGTDRPNAFAVCAPGDYTDWSSAGATTATAILHRPGKITAAVAFRDYVLAFKKSSVYKLTYTGGTFKWKVELIAIGRGAWGMHDVVHCGDSVVFNGPGGVWKFDGSSFTSLTDDFGEISQAVGSFFCPLSQNVWFLVSTTYSRTDTSFVRGTFFVYNLVSQRWGQSYPFTNLALGTSVPFEGEIAALNALVGPIARLPDRHALLKTSDLSVTRNDTYWGAGSGSQTASIIGSVEGIGGDRTTRFSELQPEYTRSLPYTGSDIGAGDTELQLTTYNGMTRDAHNLVSLTTASVSASPSYSKSRRFSVNKASPYMRPKIIVPDSAGYVEILDYKVGMAPDGKQGA